METLNFVEDSYIANFEQSSKYTFLGKDYVFNHLPFKVNRNTLEHFNKHNDLFIYPLFVGSLHLFDKELPPLPSPVLTSIKAGKGYLVFFYLNEGNFFELKHFSIVDRWCNDNKLTKSQVYFFCSNQKIKETYNEYIKKGAIKDNVNYYGVSYFESAIWSLKNLKRKSSTDIKFTKELYSSIFNNYSDNKQFYFNCLNRHPRDERVFLTVLLKSIEETNKRTSLSLGPQSILDDSYNYSNLPFNDYTIKSKDLLLSVKKFLEHNFYNIRKNGYTLDFNDFSFKGSDRFNHDFYKNSYMSIVVETLNSPKTMFLSEKTFKPIIMHHPFFLLGNKNSLKHLRNLGYKTFDKWWDESYDSYDNIYNRVYQAFLEIRKICKLSPKELSYMIQDMKDVVKFNFNHYFDNQRYLEEYKPILEKVLPYESITTFTKPII